MKDNVTTLLIFLFGAAIGSIITWTCTNEKIKKKYEDYANEEIESVKEVYSKKEEQKSDDVLSGLSAADKLIRQYASDTESEDRIVDVPEHDSDDSLSPYIISPDEFGNDDNYEIFSLYYYADDILADENNDMIMDIESVIGLDALSGFGEYEDDSVFVRNERLMRDYEILKDLRTYEEASASQYSPKKEE